jgi:osmotically-inducible protein OsmY
MILLPAQAMPTYRRSALAVFLAAAAVSTGCVHQLAKLDMSDPGIRARVQTELKSHPEFNLRYLEVNVHMRVVYLSGLVESSEIKHDIERSVDRIPGVLHVINNLLVVE